MSFSSALPVSIQRIIWGKMPSHHAYPDPYITVIKSPRIDLPEAAI